MAGTFALGTSIASAQDVALPGDPSDAEAQGEAMMDAAPDPRVGEPSEPAPDAVAEEPIATPTTPASVVAGGSDLMAEQAEAEARVAGEDDAPATVDTPSDCSGSVERPGCKYYFLGAMYRHTWTPGFILNLFTEDATKTNNVSFGLSFSYRKDGLSVVTDLYWQRFAVNGPFRGLNDPIEETEIIDSNLSAVMVGVTFLWSSNFSDVFAIEYGLGLGLGVVLGDMTRTEAYPSGDGYAPCVAPGSPVEGGRFCDGPPAADGASGGHYGVVARKWTQGGSVPNVWLRLAPTLGVRIKPIRQLQFRLGGGFDIFSGFFGEARIDIGF